MTKILNLTPHEIKIYSEDKENLRIEIPKSGEVARIPSLNLKVEEIEIEDKWGYLYKVPNTVKQYQKGQVFRQIEKYCREYDLVIVSLPLLLQASLFFKDNPEAISNLVAPDTDEGAVRDASGQIVGTVGFISVIA